VIGRYLWLLVWRGRYRRLFLQPDSVIQLAFDRLATVVRGSRRGGSAAAAGGLLSPQPDRVFPASLLGADPAAAANLVVTTGTIMAERLLYLPAVGFAAAVAFGSTASAAGWVCVRWRRSGAGAVGAAYGARTYQRNPDWQNDETLFASAAEAVPHSFRPHMSLAYSCTPKIHFLSGRAGDRAG